MMVNKVYTVPHGRQKDYSTNNWDGRIFSEPGPVASSVLFDGRTVLHLTRHFLRYDLVCLLQKCYLV